MNISACRSSLGCLLTILVISAALAGCGSKRMGEVQVWPPSSDSLTPAGLTSIPKKGTPSPGFGSTFSPLQQTIAAIQPTPTYSILGSTYDYKLDIKAGPVPLPIVLQIPSLKVGAPVLGVGLTAENAMDAPKGDYGDPIWQSAFWYRGSGIPGDPGTATIAGHVNSLLGEPAIFARIKKLKPGDKIIIHVNNTLTDIVFIVDEVKIYSLQQSSVPEVLDRIYGIGPTTGAPPQPGADGLSHLTLITCTGFYIDGEFDRHVVVYATRSDE